MTIASCRRRWSTTQNVIRSDACPARKLTELEYNQNQFHHKRLCLLPSALEMKLKEIISDFGSTLTAKHKHGIACHGNWKVATSRWAFSDLNNFFPRSWLTLGIKMIIEIFHQY